MALTLHSIAPQRGSRPKKFRVGRGLGSGRGKTAGRGTKGQRSRTGGRKRLRLKGMKQMLLGFPKIRGFQSLKGTVATIPTLRLDVFADGATITLAALKAQGLVPRSVPMAKIVGSGELKKKFVIDGLPASAAAKTAIEKAGGQFKAIKKEKRTTKDSKKK